MNKYRQILAILLAAIVPLAFATGQADLKLDHKAPESDPCGCCSEYSGGENSCSTAESEEQPCDCNHCHECGCLACSSSFTLNAPEPQSVQLADIPESSYIFISTQDLNPQFDPASVFRPPIISF